MSDDDMTALSFYSRLGHRKWQSCSATLTRKWGASSRASARLRSEMVSYPAKFVTGRPDDQYAGKAFKNTRPRAKPDIDMTLTQLI